MSARDTGKRERPAAQDHGAPNAGRGVDGLPDGDRNTHPVISDDDHRRSGVSRYGPDYSESQGGYVDDAPKPGKRKPAR